MLYTDPKQEADSIMAWLDRRLEWSTSGTLPLYVSRFKKEWCDSFGTLDTVPQEYKDKVKARYTKLKVREGRQ